MTYTLFFDWKKMRKITLLCLCSAFLFLVWCNLNIQDNVDINETDQNGWPNYEWELEIQWLAWEISFWGLESNRTLILSQFFEDHADHLTIDEWKREKRFKSEDEYLPWTKVKFKWYVQFLDWAAGNHYYDVINIDDIEVIGFMDSTWVKEFFESHNYCESDDDCAYIAWECPFGCYVPLYKDFADIAWKVMDHYFDINWKTCVYKCLYMDKVVCENYKCEMWTSE